MTDDETYTPHPALIGPWEATIAAIRALVACNKMLLVGTVVVYDTAEDTILLKAFVNPMRVDDDKQRMDLAVEASQGAVHWNDYPVVSHVVRREMRSVVVAFAGTGTDYDVAVTQLLLSLAYASLNEHHWATEHAPNSGDVVQRLGGRAISASHN